MYCLRLFLWFSKQTCKVGKCLFLRQRDWAWENTSSLLKDLEPPHVDYRVWLKPLNWAVQLMLPNEEVQTKKKFGRIHGMVSTHLSVFVRSVFFPSRVPKTWQYHFQCSSNLWLFFFKIRPQKSLRMIDQQLIILLQYQLWYLFLVEISIEHSVIMHDLITQLCEFQKSSWS